MNALRTFILLAWAIVFASGTAGQAESVTYLYDSTGRLIEARHESGLQIQYVYDSNGNLLVRRYQTFVDTDGDGMDDAWERSYFGDLSRNGLGDFDQDGATDREEFLAGTDPTSGGSVLKVTQVAGPGGSSVQIEWQSVSGKRYRVQFKNNIEDPSWTDLPGDVTAFGSTASQVDPAPNGARRFYRVLLLP